MKYLDLIWAALRRRKARTALALLSVVVAFVLFGLLDTVRNTFSTFGQNATGYDRLFVMSKMNMGNPLPLSLLPQIREVPGVTRVGYGSFLEGTYQSPKNPISVEAHQGGDYFDFYPDVDIAPAEREALRRTRTGAVVGETLAKKFHWKIGERIPLQTTTVLKDGTNILTLDVVGIYRFSDRSMRVFNNSLYINWDYFKKRLEDLSLLRRAVPIVCDGHVVDLAVPIGGKRRGGYVALATLRWCRDTMRQLKGKPGFPNLRIRKGSRTIMHNVCWGDPEPNVDVGDIDLGRYYGYSERAIEKLMKETPERDAE